jgi:threonine dehydratase
MLRSLALNVLNFATIQTAAARIRPHIKSTPVLTSELLDQRVEAKLFFKAEHRQAIGAFKARGATNAIFSLPPEVSQRGVVTHSSGNHAAAVAYAARLRGIAAHIVMPTNVPAVKRANVLAQGGIIIDCEPTIDSREQTAARVLQTQGGTLIHPYNDYAVMAGQGTAALEFLTTHPELDLILCPVGGGGLLSGTAVAAKFLRPGIRVIGVEPAAADDAAQSFHTGKLVRPAAPPLTIADGLRGALGDLTFATIQQHVDDIVIVTEAAISEATRLLQAVFDELIEPSAAVPLAALLQGVITANPHLKVGIILTGGNVDR